MSLGMGVLNRLMPTFQVFFIALPLQLLAAFATLMLSFAAGLLAFFSLFEDALATLLVGGRATVADEQDPGQKTEEPTQRRLEEARRKFRSQARARSITR